MALVTVHPRLQLVIDPDSAWRIVCLNCSRPLARGPHDSPDAVVDAGTRQAAAHRCDGTLRLDPQDASPDLRASA